LEAVAWYPRWRLLRDLVVSSGLLETVFVLAWYLKWMELVMSGDGLLLLTRLSLSLVERLEVVRTPEEPLGEQRWPE
jgi:hypothetical protein